jgi:hypothetical protein
MARAIKLGARAASELRQSSSTADIARTAVAGPFGANDASFHSLVRRRFAPVYVRSRQAASSRFPDPSSRLAATSASRMSEQAQSALPLRVKS